jgi:hypothetical protein
MIVDISTGEIENQPKSVKARSGRLGGLKGGKARAEALTPRRRSEIGRKAAETRWKQSMITPEV